MKVLLFKFLTMPLIPFFLMILHLAKVKYRVKIALINVNRIGHLALNTEVVLRRAVIINDYKDKKNEDHVILVAPTLPYHNVSNEQLVKMFARHENVYQSWFFYRFIFVWYEFLLKTPFFFLTSHAMDSNEHELFNNVGTTMEFDSNEIKEGNNILNKIGVGNNKYVCIFQRDSNYLEIKENKSQEDRDCRDANINAMIPSIKHLINEGYYVIRVGAHAKDKVSFKHNMFIDYPFTKYVSDFNDVYIVANASFLVGSTSGICDVAVLFDIPRLVVNTIPFTHSTVGKNIMFIPKKLSKKGNIVPYFDKNVKALFNEFSCDRVREKGYEYINNTEDEVLEAVKDFIKYLSSNGILESEDLKNMERYIANYLSNTSYHSVKVPLCPFWLRNNYKLYFST